MGKRTGETDFGEIADERINKKLDFSKIKTKQDYIDAVKELLKGTPTASTDNMARNKWMGQNLLPYVEELYDESDASERIAKSRQEELDALRKAQLLEAKRGKRSREVDERKTHKRTREASKRSVARWRHAMGRSDIRGVDTKRRSLFSQKNIITRRDVRLKNIRVDIDKIGRKHYRDSKGRYTTNPFNKK
jgi:hypothetical protein